MDMILRPKQDHLHCGKCHIVGVSYGKSEKEKMHTVSQKKIQENPTHNLCKVQKEGDSKT
jgi:hypothetical protein